MANKSSTIPQFPGMKPSVASPAPPKYLLISDGTGREKQVPVSAVLGASRSGLGSTGTTAATALVPTVETTHVAPVKLKQPLSSVMQSKFTTLEPLPRTYDQPAHRYKRGVDSKSEAKPSAAAAAAGGGGGGVSGAELPLRYVGTSYVHSANAPNRGLQPLPRAPALPRPFVPEHPSTFANGPQLHNRSADGKIMGSLTSKRYVDPSNVPYLEPEKPLGPDNPSKQLNETWSMHWDNEAGAVYYYNQQSGEATWIPPF